VSAGETERRGVAFVPDLLFGSQVLSMVERAGLAGDLCGAELEVRERAPGAAVLVVDLTAEPERRAAIVAELGATGMLSGTRTLGFYSHVEADTRALALEAGFDEVVPRSRMAREGSDLIRTLAEREPA
jgi:hypothetical protein